jgi:hypothetical protein
MPETAGNHLSEPTLVTFRQIRHGHTIEIDTVLLVKNGMPAAEFDQTPMPVGAGDQRQRQYVQVGGGAREAVEECDNEPAEAVERAFAGCSFVQSLQKR